MSHVDEVLAGLAPYDELDAFDQALVRDVWRARLAGRLGRLGLASEFAATGRTWVELDDRGEVVLRGR